MSSLLGRCPSNREKKKRSKGRAKLYVSVTDWFSLKTYLEDGAVIRSENVTIQWKQNSYSVAYDHMKNRWLSSGLTAGWQKGFRDARCVISPKLPAWSVIGHRKVVRDLLFSLVTRDFPFRCPWLVNIIKTSSEIRKPFLLSRNQESCFNTILLSFVTRVPALWARAANLYEKLDNSDDI